MVSITNLSSAYRAVTSLVDSSVTSAVSAKPTSSPSAADRPKDSVSLSDRAKATLALDRRGQGPADRLRAQVASSRVVLKSEPYSAKEPANANPLLDQLGSGNPQKDSS